MNETILLTKEYGRIIMNLKEVMDKNNITRNALARSVNTRFEVINKWYNGDVEKLDLDILARVCYVLKCDICDILVYDNKHNL